MLTIFKNNILYRKFIFNEEEIRLFQNNFKDAFGLNVTQRDLDDLTRRIEKDIKEIENSTLCCTYRNKTKNYYSSISIGYSNFRLLRILYQLTHPFENIKNKEILHKCDNRWCCNIRHLSSGTHLENMKDMMDKCRNPRGETHHNSIHSDSLIIKIIEDILSEDPNRCKTYKDIVTKYGIIKGSFSSIVNKKVRTDVTNNYDMEKVQKILINVNRVHGRHINAKLSDLQIKEIRNHYHFKILTAEQIKLKYEISETTFRNIVNKRTYKDVS